ncbi:MAG TPA: metallophosphoesterase family protein [Streptosporangiaceae bacterium]|nr:metallophosphoesterase family protein [Streptosporangiaceae bacterium]
MSSPSSHQAAAGAGWDEAHRLGAYENLLPDRKMRGFSWLNPIVLWRSRNDFIASRFSDPTDDVRRRWVAEQLARGAHPDFLVSLPALESFLVLGDPGEGDRSQYAVVPGLLAAGADTSLMIIASDVIYPVGSVNDYPDKFFRPYQGYPAPIYAVPGNHDWYDGLGGFMRVFCDAPGQPTPRWRGRFGGLARLLWRRPAVADEAALAAGLALRSAPGQRATQPGPYWAIDTPRLRIVGVDTGINGDIDGDQAEWLRRVSAGPKPKLLITGKPLIVDNQRRPRTVGSIVTDPACNYVAAIGGDIHNYQRYPVTLDDGRTIQYIVSGGGGAFMAATHVIPKVTVVDEDDFVCYPLRGDSLTFYSRLYGRRLHMRWFFELTYEQAAAAIAHRLGLTPTRREAHGVRPSARAKLVAALLGVPGRGGRATRWFRLPVRRAYHRLFSSSSDSDRPPFFKSFLRIDIEDEALRIRCFAATGWMEHERRPPVEDEVTIPLGSRDGELSDSGA